MIHRSVGHNRGTDDIYHPVLIRIRMDLRLPMMPIGSSSLVLSALRERRYAYGIISVQRILFPLVSIVLIDFDRHSWIFREYTINGVQVDKSFQITQFLGKDLGSAF